jgi:hypothetical protein
VARRLARLCTPQYPAVEVMEKSFSPLATDH